MSTHVITTEEEMKEHGQLVTEIRGREIAVFHIDGEFYAYTNWCPHQSGPAFEGHVSGYRDACFDRETLETEKEWTREEEIISCPWHGWEFDLKTGECVTKENVQVPQYDVRVEDGNVVLEV
jgi:nitrite reductase/ring-hydroxylating ferredoxin subunit